MQNYKNMLLTLVLLVSFAATNVQTLAYCDYDCGGCGCENCDCYDCACDNCGHDCDCDCYDCEKSNFYAYRQSDRAIGSSYTRRWISSNDTEKYIPEGSTIRIDGGVDVYIVKYVEGKLFKRLVLNPDVFENYEHLRWGDVLNVSRDVLDLYVTSDLVRSDSTGRVYRLYPLGDCGTKRMAEYQGRFWNDIDWDSVYIINGFDERSYTTGYSIN